MPIVDIRIYILIASLNLARDSAVAAFSVLDMMKNPRFLANIATQSVVWIGGQSVGGFQNYGPHNALPAISIVHLAITNPSAFTPINVSTLSLLLAGAGGTFLSGDLNANLSIQSAVVAYIECLKNTSNVSSGLFVCPPYSTKSRLYNKYRSPKQHFIFSGVTVILIVGGGFCIKILIISVKRIIRRLNSFRKK